MPLRRGVTLMCLLCEPALWQLTHSFVGFAIRRLQGRIASFEILPDGGCQSIRATRYSKCQPDSSAGLSSTLIFPDPGSWEETGRLAPRAVEPARHREQFLQSMHAEDPLAVASEAVLKAFLNCAWERANLELSRKLWQRAWETCHPELENPFRKNLPNQIASEWRRLPAPVLPAARTIDRVNGPAGTQAAQAPRRRNRAPFLLRNALRALPAQSNANSHPAPIRGGELLPVPAVLTIAAEGAPPALRSRAHPNAPTFQEFPWRAKARTRATRPNASLLLLKQSK